MTEGKYVPFVPRERWATQGETAEHMGKPVSWLHHEAAALGIPRYKIGNQWRYRLSEVDQWIESNRADAS